MYLKLFIKWYQWYKRYKYVETKKIIVAKRKMSDDFCLYKGFCLQAISKVITKLR